MNTFGHLDRFGNINGLGGGSIGRVDQFVTRTHGRLQ